MTKRDFELIADAIADTNIVGMSVELTARDREAIREQFAESFIKALSRTNERFDEERFFVRATSNLTATRVEPETADTFKPTHRYRATLGDPSELVQVIRYEPPFAYGRQAVVRFANRVGEWRVGESRLIAVDGCSCETVDDGNGETGPQPRSVGDPNCPEHGETEREYEIVDVMRSRDFSPLDVVHATSALDALSVFSRKHGYAAYVVFGDSDGVAVDEYDAVNDVATATFTNSTIRARRTVQS